MPLWSGGSIKERNTGFRIRDCKVEDGRVTFFSDLGGIARANMFLRTAERILLKVGAFRASTFEQLFDRTAELAWEEFIPEDGKFWVKKASTAKSRLYRIFSRSSKKPWWNV